MTLLGPDPVAEEAERVLRLLEQGVPASDRLESRGLDLTEEPGRRRGSQVLEGQRQSEQAASYLAGEAVCMANTAGGGLLVVGVADDHRVIGTELDAEWLRRRVYDLTDRRLTVTVTATMLRGSRILLVRSPEAVQLISWRGRYRHRVDDGCVEVDPATWVALQRERTGYDWSGEISALTLHDVRPTALQRARDFLVEAGDERSVELAGLRDADLLRRLNAVDGRGRLTNAAALVFVGRRPASIDYLRRDVAGGDSVARLRPEGRALLEELYDVDAAMSAANPLRHLSAGLVQRRLRLMPPRALREAVVNGVAHRDWMTEEPTLVEQVGARLVVTSPGGFVGGVTSSNIVTHPSQPRNRALAELLAALRLAEREGIGVDRMFGDMVRLGHQPPSIDEVPGPHVRAVLRGSTLDEAWITFLAALRPASAASDLDSLLVLAHLVGRWWVDAAVAAPILQRTQGEARDAIDDLASAAVEGAPVLEPVSTPSTGPPAWRLSTRARGLLARLDAESGRQRPDPSRAQVALAWARSRGRVSTTELGRIVGVSPTNLGGVLRGLEDEGLLAPGRENRRGAGFFYTPTEEGLENLPDLESADAVEAR